MPENRCPGDCPLVPRVEALERANQQHIGTHREVFDRLRELERLEGIQGEQYKNILEKLDTLTRRHDELNRKLDELEAKPGKRWESIVGQAAGLIVAALFGAIAARLGL